MPRSKAGFVATGSTKTAPHLPESNSMQTCGRGIPQLLLRVCGYSGYSFDQVCSSFAGRIFSSLFFSEDVINNKEMIPHVTTILKLFALGAHRYSLVNYTWNEYSPPELESDPLDFIAYGEKINLTPLPVGTPATLAYLSLYNKIRVSRASAIASVSTLPKSSSLEPRRLRDCAWQRGVVIPRPIINLSTVFKTGSVDGVWEGMFTVRYTIPSETPLILHLVCRVHVLHGDSTGRSPVCSFKKFNRATSSDVENPRACTTGFVRRRTVVRW